MARRRYRIEIAPSAVKELAGLPKSVRDRIMARIDGLASDPRPPGAVKLKGEAERWRVRIGDYRVIYDIADNVLLVLVLKIGHRRDVYRRR